MKKLLFGLSMSVVMLQASAALNFPNNFQAEFQNEDSLKDWGISVPDGMAAGSYADYFNFRGPVPQLTVNNVNFILTNCEYEDGSASDTWLITPEFTVTEDEMMLSYTTGVIGDYEKVTANTLKVLCSETGADKESFTTTVQTLNLRLKSTETFSVASQRVMLSGMKGKKIRLAFVNEGNTTGVIALADVNVTPWYLKINAQSSYYSYLLDPENPEMKMTMTVSTPRTATGYKVALRTASGFETAYEDNLKKFNLNNASTVTFSFPKAIEMQGDTEAYTITITPNFEGVNPAVIDGTLIKAERKYPAVAVAEEVTGTWCGWCPGGIAKMNMWASKYAGSNANKFIGIALHKQDPMSISYEDTYLKGFDRQAAKVGLESTDPPAVIVNRIQGDAPLAFDMDSFLNTQSYASLKIVDNKTMGAAGDKVTVDYEYLTSFSAEYPGLAVAAVVVEDDVTGEDEYGEWDQSNYFAPYTQDQIKQMYGDEIIPFFAPFLEQGSSTVPASQMKYQEVARGIFPSYDGLNISDAVTADVASKGRFEFNLPDNIENIENARVILMLLKQSSGEILSADEMNLKIDTAVESIDMQSGLTVISEGNSLIVESESVAHIDIYSLEGYLVKAELAQPGVTRIILPAGTYVVKAVNASANRTLKSIIR